MSCIIRCAEDDLSCAVISWSTLSLSLGSLHESSCLTALSFVRPSLQHLAGKVQPFASVVEPNDGAKEGYPTRELGTSQSRTFGNRLTRSQTTLRTEISENKAAPLSTTA